MSDIPWGRVEDEEPDQGINVRCSWSTDLAGLLLKPECTKSVQVGPGEKGQEPESWLVKQRIFVQVFAWP